MRKRVQIALAVLVAAIAGVIAWQVLSLREPVYQGKRLSIWLQRYGANGDSSEVDDAVRTMGTKAIPTLLANLQARDSALKLTLAALGLHYTPAEIRHMRAEKGFSALEEVASNAVPALIEIYEQNSSLSARRAAANALVEDWPCFQAGDSCLDKEYDQYQFGCACVCPLYVGPDGA